MKNLLNNVDQKTLKIIKYACTGITLVVGAIGTIVDQKYRENENTEVLQKEIQKLIADNNKLQS